MCIFEGRAFQQAGTTRVKDPEAGACFFSLKDQHGEKELAAQHEQGGER